MVRRTKTVLWSFLLGTATPAGGAAVHLLQSGNQLAALLATGVMFIAVVGFVISFTREFPTERDIKRLLNAREVSDAEVERVARRAAEVVEENAEAARRNEPGSGTGEQAGGDR